MPVDLDLTVNRLAEWPALADLEPLLRTAALLAVSRVAPDARGELSVTCLSEAEMSELNRCHLNRGETTDVIAFDLGDGEQILGDIYVAPETVMRQATAYGASAEEETVRVVIHGVLHVLGLDHPSGPDREDSAMYRLQEELLGELLPR